jgi:hypothetical protein
MTVRHEIGEESGEREDSLSGHPIASDPIPVNREIPNVTHKFIPLHLFISICQFVAITNALVLIWLMGTQMPPPWSATARFLLLVFGTATAVTSLRLLWIFGREGDLWMVGLAASIVLASLVLFDLWDGRGEVRIRDIVLLILSGVAALPAVGSQLSAWHRQKKGADHGVSA